MSRLFHKKNGIEVYHKPISCSFWMQLHQKWKKKGSARTKNTQSHERKMKKKKKMARKTSCHTGYSSTSYFKLTGRASNRAEKTVNNYTNKAYRVFQYLQYFFTDVPNVVGRCCLYWNSLWPACTNTPTCIVGPPFYTCTPSSKFSRSTFTSTLFWLSKLQPYFIKINVKFHYRFKITNSSARFLFFSNFIDELFLLA